MPEILILAFDGGATYAFSRADRHSWSVFGGPMQCKISGKRPVPDRLHYIARLSFNHLPILGPPNYVFDLPLLYGLRYRGGTLAYKFEHSDISVLESPGKLSNGWPYRDYPPILPFVPLALSKRKKQSWHQFAAAFPNMKVDQPSDVVVIVPPPMTIGVSLWGQWGDDNAMVFECDLKQKTVTAYSVST
jgi:hypothetical protein